MQALKAATGRERDVDELTARLDNAAAIDVSGAMRECLAMAKQDEAAMRGCRERGAAACVWCRAGAGRAQRVHASAQNAYNARP